MGLKPKYKQTEVGVIPEDWNVHTLRGCLSAQPDYGINAPAVPFSDKLPAYIRITDITEDGRFSPEKPVSVKRADANRYYLNDGDIVFARTGASVGKSYLYRPTDGKLVFAGFLIRVSPDAAKLVPAYLAGYVTTGAYWNWVRLMSMRSGQPGINGKEYGQLPIPLPPTIDEQRAIAGALSDVDALIGALNQLIAKKRDLKQAAMQQLLTGQKRLPGFHGEWEVKRLGDCLLSRPDYGINAAAVPFSDKLPSYIRITDISEHGRFCPDPRVSVKAANTDQYFLQEGEVVFARTGASVGKSYLYEPHDGQLVFAGFLIRVRPNPDLLVPAFLAAYATTKPYWNWVRLMSMRSGQPGINGNEYAQLPLSLPPLPEQTAIAEVLSDMDAELAALEQRRNKTRALKQGMMQELLTGRTRLPLDEGTPCVA
ncbi:MAG: hypothetical protein A2038_01275 [Deltaproteobacteria bacterium GWA2_57_13]|nr:MAG: hypothetical protein A2038_01275 [Deltaproteobacteria bacterium GWA2_57_13]